ncbi:hypothetical protein AZZ92_005009, partial [Escherichia coli]
MQLRSPARWADSHIDMYVACVIRGLCSSAGRWSYGVVSPVTGRVAAANAQYGAATRRRAAVPARRRAAPTAHHRGGRAAAAWRRAGLWL